MITIITITITIIKIIMGLDVVVLHLGDPDVEVRGLLAVAVRLTLGDGPPASHQIMP